MSVAVRSPQYADSSVKFTSLQHKCWVESYIQGEAKNWTEIWKYINLIQRTGFLLSDIIV